MNTELLLALGLGLGGAVLLAVLLLRRRTVAPRPTEPAAPALDAAQPAPPAQAAPGAAPAGPAAAHPPAALLDAQRQATTEALRLARQRKAEEATRLEAARAEADALAAAQHAAQQAAHQAAQRQAADRQIAERQAAQRMAMEREAAQRQAQARLEAERRDAEQRAAERRAADAARPTAGPSAVSAPARSAVPAAAVAPHVPLILVADDSKVVRVKTGRLLEKQGWQVLLAEDGAAALALLDSHRPDLLVTDVEMPGLDGFALTRRVRAHARGARLPVVMITSSDDRHRADASAAGVDLLLGKPYEEDALLGHLRRLLKLPAAQAEAALH